MTVRVDDPPPGRECQVDFGRLGFVPDGERRRVCHGLIFTACASAAISSCGRRSLQTTEEVIRGFEAAWGYFAGVFPVVIPDNMKSIVITAENTAPRFNDVFIEYAQSRGFVIDAARVATPTDKPRVERVVHYVATELLRRRGASSTWPTAGPGPRLGARKPPACASTARPSADPSRRSGPRSSRCSWLSPGAPFDTPTWSEPKVHRDFHVEVDKALYSVPHLLVGRHVKARRDASTVKLYVRGELVKVHPRKAPGQRSHRPGRLPKGHRDLRHP